MSERSSALCVDVVVVGCGAAGLAAAAELSARGRSVIGLEQFDFAHTNGSSHGTERIVRVAYADAVHAEMAARSIVGWQRLERDADVSLLTPTGGLDVGSTAEIEQLALQCERVGVGVDRWSTTEANRRFPMFSFGAPPGDFGDGDRVEVMHHAASTVNADRALLALRSQAEGRGAVFRSGARVDSIDVIGDEAVIVHHDGITVEATTVVIAAGGWAGAQWVRSATDDDVRLPEATVTQEQVAFFRPTSTVRWPTFVDRSDPCVYGLPTPDGLVKVGEHHTGPVIDIAQRTHQLEPMTWERLQRWVAEHLPGVDPVPVQSTTCLYAYYPGDTFLLDRVGPVVLGLGLSGHGFKFAPEVGRLLADLVDRVADDENPFGLDRPMIEVGESGRR